MKPLTLSPITPILLLLLSLPTPITPLSLSSAAKSVASKAAGAAMSKLSSSLGPPPKRKPAEQIIDGPNYAGFSMQPTIDEFSKQQLNFYANEVNDLSQKLGGKLNALQTSVLDRLNKIRSVALVMEPREKGLEEIEGLIRGEVEKFKGKGVL